ncbi:MAG: hypothetical protein RLY20_513 [Verrucomicrobiota bacterium]
MGMIGCFYALKDEDLEVLIQHPKRIHHLWGRPAPTPKPSLLARLFGAGQKTSAPRDDWKPSEPPKPFDVDKAWHGIHFLLTGSDWEGEGPLAFVLCGGREINEDLGYGPAHGFTSAEVHAIDAALRDITGPALYEKADPADFKKHDLYPDVWEHEPKDECIGYVTTYFDDLKKFVHETAQANRALIAYIG